MLYTHVLRFHNFFFLKTVSYTFLMVQSYIFSFTLVVRPLNLRWTRSRHHRLPSVFNPNALVFQSRVGFDFLGRHRSRSTHYIFSFNCNAHKLLAVSQKTRSITASLLHLIVPSIFLILFYFILCITFLYRFVSTDWCPFDVRLFLAVGKGRGPMRIVRTRNKLDTRNFVIVFKCEQSRFQLK